MAATSLQSNDALLRYYIIALPSMKLDARLQTAGYFIISIYSDQKCLMVESYQSLPLTQAYVRSSVVCLLVSSVGVRSAKSNELET